jgi:hypothetical protein
MAVHRVGLYVVLSRPAAGGQQATHATLPLERTGRRAAGPPGLHASQAAAEEERTPGGVHRRSRGAPCGPHDSSGRILNRLLYRAGGRETRRRIGPNRRGRPAGQCGVTDVRHGRAFRPSPRHARLLLSPGFLHQRAGAAVVRRERRPVDAGLRHGGRAGVPGIRVATRVVAVGDGVRLPRRPLLDHVVGVRRPAGRAASRRHHVRSLSGCR